MLLSWVEYVSRIWELVWVWGDICRCSFKTCSRYQDFLHRKRPARKRHPFCAQRDPLVKRITFYKHFKKFHKKWSKIYFWSKSKSIFGREKTILVVEMEVRGTRNLGISSQCHSGETRLLIIAPRMFFWACEQPSMTFGVRPSKMLIMRKVWKPADART